MSLSGSFYRAYQLQADNTWKVIYEGWDSDLLAATEQEAEHTNWREIYEYTYNYDARAWSGNRVGGAVGGSLYENHLPAPTTPPAPLAPPDSSKWVVIRGNFYIRKNVYYSGIATVDKSHSRAEIEQLMSARPGEMKVIDFQDPVRDTSQLPAGDSSNRYISFIVLALRDQKDPVPFDPSVWGIDSTKFLKAWYQPAVPGVTLGDLNAPKTLSTQAKIGIGAGVVALVGTGGYLWYRHAHKRTR